MMQRKKLIILGSTGSVGTNALRVCRYLKDQIEIVGLSAHTNSTGLLSFGRELGVTNMALSGGKPEVDGISYYGMDGLRRMIEEVDADIILNGISGSAGFLPSLWAIHAGRTLVLANKETIIIGGHIFQELVRKSGHLVMMVDSEHSALHHLLRGELADHTGEIILTASGGPFRNLPVDALSSISVDDALRHPTWKMGPKITVDSSTLANKGLEVMEAFYLFNIPQDRIKVIIHPQSLVHSMIRTVDGVLYAQISTPDMAHPIQNALTYPRIIAPPLVPLDLTERELTFHPVDEKKFPLLPLAYAALRLGGSYPIAYNAANEVAVNRFLNGEIPYNSIYRVVAECLNRDWGVTPTDFEDCCTIDGEIRSMVAEEIPLKELV